MTERAARLGIHPQYIFRALQLVRDQRVQVINEGIDSRAYRIALIYANKVDFYFARKNISEKELVALEEIADDYFRETYKAMNKKGVR